MKHHIIYSSESEKYLQVLKKEKISLPYKTLRKVLNLDKKISFLVFNIESFSELFSNNLFLINRVFLFNGNNKTENSIRKLEKKISLFLWNNRRKFYKLFRFQSFKVRLKKEFFEGLKNKNIFKIEIDISFDIPEEKGKKK